MTNPNDPEMIRISKEEVRALPLIQFEGPIHLVDTPGGVRKALDELSSETVLGFDTESRPSFRKGVSYSISLIQICTLEVAYLLRINLTGVTPELLAFLENPNIIKAGVGLANDITGLQELAPMKLKGLLDLGIVAQDNHVQTIGLRNLSGLFLGHRISKRSQISNWERQYLTPAQRVYAATDAWVSLLLHQQFVEKGWITPGKLKC